MTCDRFERDGLLAYLAGKDDPHTGGCADCRAARDSYARLITAIGREPAHALPRGWKERTLSRLRHAQLARRRRLVWRATIAAAAVAAVLVYVLRPPPPEPRVAVRIEAGSGTWRGPAAPGSILDATADGSRFDAFELRVYYESRELLVRCPGGAPPACRVDGDEVHVRMPLTSIGKYQVVWMVSSDPIPASVGDLELDIVAAREAGATMAPLERTEVR